MDFWVNKKPATLGAGLSLHLKERSLICVTLIMLRRTPWGVVRAEKKAHSPSGPMGRTRRISSTTPLNLTRWVVLSLGPSTSQASALTELCTVPPLENSTGSSRRKHSPTEKGRHRSTARSSAKYNSRKGTPRR